ncbi:MAG: DNA-directed RNA polymerase subunit F [Candidatus Thermoplasmatota archaeon]|nr:DNA-directed RNA polymerase subunit F [Candidatus Thermoplasmatota archaeon]
MPEDPLEGAEMLSIPAVRDLLEREREERGELSYEQKLAFEHALMLDRIKDADKAQKLYDELVESVDRITPEQAIKLVDLAPQHEDEVEVVFAKDRQALSKEDSDTIMSIVQKYLE